jgi:hypothetical protein
MILIRRRADGNNCWTGNQPGQKMAGSQPGGSSMGFQAVIQSPMSETKNCPFCKTPASQRCEHLALVVRSPQLIAHCVGAARAEDLWERYCQQTRSRQREESGGELPDFTWLESSFCDEFLKRLEWFGQMTYEWRNAVPPEQGKDLWVWLWSKHPQRLWWQLRDKLEQHLAKTESVLETKPHPAPSWESSMESLFRV